MKIGNLSVLILHLNLTDLRPNGWINDVSNVYNDGVHVQLFVLISMFILMPLILFSLCKVITENHCPRAASSYRERRLVISDDDDGSNTGHT